MMCSCHRLTALGTFLNNIFSSLTLMVVRLFHSSFKIIRDCKPAIFHISIFDGSIELLLNNLWAFLSY